MTKTIAIGLLGLLLSSNGTAAQSAVEQAQILREFDASVTAHVQHQGLPLFPGALTTADARAPQIFTLPVAMVFRQLISRALHGPDVRAIGGVGTTPHAEAGRPFPAHELYDFPDVLREALPALPPPYEYRLIDHDLAIRDGAGDRTVAVLRDALGTTTIVQR